jgi:hypothetical protein
MSYPSIEAPLKPRKLGEGIGKCGRDIGSQLAVQSFRLDEPRTNRRISKSPSEVPRCLCVVVQTLAPGGVAARNCECAESNVVHDHIRLGQH